MELQEQGRAAGGATEEVEEKLISPDGGGGLSLPLLLCRLSSWKLWIVSCTHTHTHLILEWRWAYPRRLFVCILTLPDETFNEEQKTLLSGSVLVRTFGVCMKFCSPHWDDVECLGLETLLIWSVCVSLCVRRLHFCSSSSWSTLLNLQQWVTCFTFRLHLHIH